MFDVTLVVASVLHAEVGRKKEKKRFVDLDRW